MGDSKSRLMLPLAFPHNPKLRPKEQSREARYSLGLEPKGPGNYLASLRLGVRFLSFMSSRSLVTVRQLLTVPIVPSFESK